MAEHKLLYFDRRGLAELTRWIFLYADIPFTDQRVEREEWLEIKKSVPSGKLPVLYIGEKPLWQSMAIARYAATKAGIVPDCPVRAAFCDAFVETAKELLTEMYKIILASDKTEEEKAKMKEEYRENVLIPFLNKVNKRMETNEWLIGDKLSWADLAVARSLDEMKEPFIPDELKKYPAIQSHVEKIYQNPKIKEWRAKRPDSPF